MAGEKQVAPGAGITGVTNLLTELGGTKTTVQNNGDTSGLYGVLGQLQSQDPNALLASIFQQAAGAIPGMSARLSNAVGARSGNNSPVAALLAKTLQQTALAGQAQVSQQKQQNLATQGSVAGDIARATNSPVTTATPNYKGAGGALAALQLASKVPDAYKKGKDFFGDLFSSSPETASTVSSDIPSLASEISSTPTFMPGLGNALQSAIGDLGGYFGSADTSSQPDPSELNYADGGLVGRDRGVPYITRKRMADAGLDDDPQEDQDRKAAIAAANKKQKEKDSKAKNSYDATSNMVDQSTGIRFADGGEVDLRSAGGRRSSAPEYMPKQALASTADQSVPLGNFSFGGMDNPNATGNGINTDAGPGNGSPGGWGKALGVLGAAMTMNPVAMALALATAVDAPSDVTNGGKAVNALASKNPVALIQALMALNKNKDAAGGAAPTEGFNSLGQATGIDNGNGYSGLNAALGFDPTAADTTTPSMANTVSDLASQVGGYGSTGGFGGTNGSAGGTTGNGEGDGGSTASAANGGKMSGPGTGTSDSIVAHLSNGEYVMSADVVRQLGTHFFDSLQSQFHTPVTPDSPNWKKSAPADSDGE